MLLRGIPVSGRRREVMASITVNIYPTGDGQVLLECTLCGPLAPMTHHDATTFVFNHLQDTHGCDMDSTKIHELPDDHPEEP